MAKRTYNRRGRMIAKTPVRGDVKGRPEGAGRKQRQTAAKVARQTGSKDRVTRGRGVTRKPVGAPRGAAGPATPPQQGPNRALPRNITMGGPKGPRTAPSGPPAGRPRLPTGKQLRTAAKVGTIVNPRTDIPTKTAAAASLLMDLATQKKAAPKKSTPTKPSPGMAKGAVKKAKADAKETNRQSAAASFDRAFAAARKAGKKTFTWRGKSYNTKMK